MFLLPREDDRKKTAGGGGRAGISIGVVHLRYQRCKMGSSVVHVASRPAIETPNKNTSTAQVPLQGNHADRTKLQRWSHYGERPRQLATLGVMSRTSRGLRWGGEAEKRGQARIAEAKVAACFFEKASNALLRSVVDVYLPPCCLQQSAEIVLGFPGSQARLLPVDTLVVWGTLCL